MNKLFEDIISEITSGEKFPNTDYISTGYESINLLLGGFQPGKLIVIGGRPAMGKTTLAINIDDERGYAANSCCLLFFRC